MRILKFIERLPQGYSEVLFQNKRYGVTRTDFNAGKSKKLYAKELGGRNFISVNYYETSTGFYVKPCEMPLTKVLDFLKENIKINDKLIKD